VKNKMLSKRLLLYLH